jgi:hypothetical protein
MLPFLVTAGSTGECYAPKEHCVPKLTPTPDWFGEADEFIIGLQKSDGASGHLQAGDVVAHKVAHDLETVLRSDLHRLAVDDVELDERRSAHAVDEEDHAVAALEGQVLEHGLSTVPDAESFSYPLSSEQVRQAYFLGKTTDDQKVVKFLDPYLHRLPYPKKGPYVESVEFRSPYEQVVLRSRQHLNNYSAADAQRDYDANPKLFLLRILIFATPSYTAPVAPTKQDSVWLWTYDDFVKGFHFTVAQEHAVEPQKITVGPACPPPNQCEPFSGVEVLLQVRRR